MISGTILVLLVITTYTEPQTHELESKNLLRAKRQAGLSFGQVGDGKYVDTFEHLKDEAEDQAKVEEEAKRVKQKTTQQDILEGKTFKSKKMKRFFKRKNQAEKKNSEQLSKNNAVAEDRKPVDESKGVILEKGKTQKMEKKQKAEKKQEAEKKQKAEKKAKAEKKQETEKNEKAEKKQKIERQQKIEKELKIEKKKEKKGKLKAGVGHLDEEKRIDLMLEMERKQHEAMKQKLLKSKLGKLFKRDKMAKAVVTSAPVLNPFDRHSEWLETLEKIHDEIDKLEPPLSGSSQFMDVPAVDLSDPAVAKVHPELDQTLESIEESDKEVEERLEQDLAKERKHEKFIPESEHIHSEFIPKDESPRIAASQTELAFEKALENLEESKNLNQPISQNINSELIPEDIRPEFAGLETEIAKENALNSANKNFEMELIPEGEYLEDQSIIKLFRQKKKQFLEDRSNKYEPLTRRNGLERTNRQKFKRLRRVSNFLKLLRHRIGLFIRGIHL